MKQLIKKIGNIVLAMLLVISITFPMSGTQEVKAAAPYYIQVNKSTNVVTVFQNKVNGVYKNPIKAFRCSVGYSTPSGTFHTQGKYRWHTLFGPSYGQYCTRIVGSFLFHSVWYYEYGKPDTISVAEYNKLGTTASQGCVRLTVADAKWIYDNCPSGTEVKMMNGTAKDDPLGKPVTPKLNENKKRDWCPTDPDARNPYKKKKTTITGIGNKTILIGKKFDPLLGVKAVEGTGTAITERLEVKGKVNEKKAGTYTLTYKVKDSFGKITSKKRKIVVKDNTNVVISANDKTIQLGTVFEEKKGVVAKTKAGSNCSDSLKVSGNVDTNQVGEYTLTYSAKNKSGKTATKIVTITVKDMKQPSLLGVENHTIYVTGAGIDLRQGVTAKSSNGVDLTERIQIEGDVDTSKAGTYKVIYSVENDSNLKTTKTAIYTVKDPNAEDEIVLQGIEKAMKLSKKDGNMTEEETLSFIKEEMKKKVSVYKNNIEQTKDELEIQVKKNSDNQYEVLIQFHQNQESCIVTLE